MTGKRGGIVHFAPLKNRLRATSTALTATRGKTGTATSATKVSATDSKAWRKVSA